eukprot:CAMPEP_0113870114 /NCGR_PEP_ID=MMETSP0780_2-20120614/1903_1 /TAXON_ID=652834 /ORGANISM="Palpitomonas bilix" /LENGTH=176 /DNA_ID=CAMNT_0000855349 /DNA_START=222 /DNA_END=752 /DNA_ORIENTATION=- /assembly_acc=CAM_ASM_000599
MRPFFNVAGVDGVGESSSTPAYSSLVSEVRQWLSEDRHALLNRGGWTLQKGAVGSSSSDKKGKEKDYVEVWKCTDPTYTAMGGKSVTLMTVCDVQRTTLKALIDTFYFRYAETQKGWIEEFKHATYLYRNEENTCQVLQGTYRTGKILRDREFLWALARSPTTTGGGQVGSRYEQV